MKRIALVAGLVPMLMGVAMPADAIIHDMVAAYCSGGSVGVIDSGGSLAPPGIDDMSKSNFAKPVIVTGVVVGAFPFEIGDSPAAKYQEGNSVFALGDPVHPSAEHCANSPLP